MPIPKLVIASANPDKVAEIAIVLEGIAVLIPRPEGMPDVIEDGNDLEDHATDGGDSPKPTTPYLNKETA